MKTINWRICNDNSQAATRYIQRGPVTHVEYLTGDGLGALGAHPMGGVAARPINFKVFSLDLRFSASVTEDQYNKLFNFLMAQMGKPYDLVDITTITVNKARDWRNSGKWTAAELWVAGLEQADIIGALYPSIYLFTPTDALALSTAMFSGAVTA